MIRIRHSSLRGKQHVQTMIPVLVVGLLCFVAGYGIRAYISFRRRYKR